MCRPWRFADLEVGFEVLELLEIVPVLEDDRRPAVLERPDDQVQVSSAFRALIEGIEAEEMADDLLESRLRVVEPEADAIPRIDVHPVEELIVEDARLLQEAALLVDIVLGLGHGAGRDTRRPS
jgi:hypothetical protein